ncbi:MULTISPECIES: hypothetical protein [Streptomyces]|nr:MULTISPECIES: hypothetical protein [Streptomyces]CAD5911888.1 protein of unknown function [Streptomyces sp. KY70]CAD5995238.1 protein of unknown function [Streptomyces sp. KY75]
MGALADKYGAKLMFPLVSALKIVPVLPSSISADARLVSAWSDWKATG